MCVLTIHHVHVDLLSFMPQITFKYMVCLLANDYKYMYCKCHIVWILMFALTPILLRLILRYSLSSIAGCVIANLATITFSTFLALTKIHVAK